MRPRLQCLEREKTSEVSCDDAWTVLYWLRLLHLTTGATVSPDRRSEYPPNTGCCPPVTKNEISGGGRSRHSSRFARDVSRPRLRPRTNVQFLVDVLQVTADGFNTQR